MKSSLALSSLLLASAAMSISAVEVGEKIAKITTKEGKTYHQVVIRKILPEGISIMHKDGAATIPAVALPDALARGHKFVDNAKIAKPPAVPAIPGKPPSAAPTDAPPTSPTDAKTSSPPTGSSIPTPDSPAKVADTLMRRMSSFDPAIGREWIDSLKVASGEDVSSLDVILFLVKQDKLFPNEQFLKSRSDQLLTRLKVVSRNDIGRWRSVIASTSGDKLTLAQTVVLMIQIDRLFPRERFSSDESTTLLSRLKTISGDAISKRQKEKGGDRSQSSLAICMEDAK
jgi:hypothetical protein